MEKDNVKKRIKIIKMLDYIKDKLKEIPIIGKILSILDRKSQVKGIQQNTNVWNEVMDIYNDFISSFDDIILPIIENHRLDIIQSIRSELLNLPRKLETSKFRLVFERFWLFIISRIRYHKYYKHKIDGNTYTNLMIISYGNQIPSILPVLKQFKASDNIVNILYTHHKLVKRVKKMIKENNLVNVVIIPFIYYHYRAFKEIYLDLVLFYYNLFDNDSPFHEPISDIIKRSFLHIFYKIIHIMYQVSVFENIHNINLISIFNGNDPLDKMIIKYAKHKNIPTLYYHHAVITNSVQFDKVEADYVIVSGDRDKNIFIERGTNPSNIYDLGLPLYDNLYEKKQKLCHFDIPLEKKILFVTTWYDDNIRRRAYRSVIETVHKLNNDLGFNESIGLLRVIVKIHPNENLDFYYKWHEKFGYKPVVDFITKDRDLIELINWSDLVIGLGTGAEFEAILMDKPVIDLNLGSIESDLYEFEEVECVISAKESDKLDGAINNLLTNKELKQQLSLKREIYKNYSISKFDGKASERIKDLIVKIVNKEV